MYKWDYFRDGVIFLEHFLLRDWSSDGVSASFCPNRRIRRNQKARSLRPGLEGGNGIPQDSMHPAGVRTFKVPIASFQDSKVRHHSE